MEINKLKEEKNQLESQVRDMLESIKMLDSVILREEEKHNQEEERKVREAAAHKNLILLSELREDIVRKARKYNSAAAGSDINTSLSVLVSGIDYEGNVMSPEEYAETNSPEYLVEGDHWYPSSANC